MFSLFNDQFILRAEQSRVSYNLQTEEFRSLNANLENYLGDIKIIDDENRQLQENIQLIRTKYISTIENHLKGLPNDFRQHSQILTDAHIERYKYKSRTRRLVTEREELKRRIQFVANSEKDQIKYLNILEKQERSNRNELEKLNKEYQRLVKYVENEKQIHRQAMNKVDNLQIKLEQTCIDRSKIEFEIQTLKEEVQLMQTTKEFLTEECETIISTQTEANEYLLSRLHDSITRIREDFDQLNQAQIQQIENDYKQMLQTLEENLLSNQTIEISQQTIPSEYQQLEQEHQIVLEELTTLNNQNQNLAERVLAMEANLYSLRNERMQQLISKDNELERSKIELQTLNEKLNHLAEYDRNLKFELTLYRGVLEGEYRRKQSVNNQSQLIRPTSLRTINQPLITDRRTWWTVGTNQSKWNDQQQDEILTNENSVQIYTVVTTKSSSNDQKPPSGESLWQQEDRTSRTSSVSTGTQKSPTSSIPSILRTDRSASTQSRRLPTPPEVRSSPTTSSPDQKTSPINAIPFAFEILQSSSISPQQYQVLSEIQQPSSRTSSINAGTSSEVQRSPTSSTIPTAATEQLTSFQANQSPSTSPQEHQPLSRTSSTSSKSSSDIPKSPLLSTTPTVPELQSFTSDVRQLTSTPLEDLPTLSDTQKSTTTTNQENQPSTRTSSISSKTSLDFERSPVPTTTVVPEHKSSTSDIHQLSSTPPQEHQPSSRTSSTSSKTAFDLQRSHLAATARLASELKLSTPNLQQSPLQDDEPLSRTSSTSSKSSSDIPKSPLLSTTPTVPELQSSTSDVRQLTSTPLEDLPTLSDTQKSSTTTTNQENQPSTRTSSISSKTSLDFERSPAPTTSVVPEHKSSTSDIHQLPSTPPQEHQPSSRTSSTSSKTAFDLQRSPLAATTPLASELKTSTSDVQQLSLQENQSPSRTSSISSETSADVQKSSLLATISELQSPTSDVRQLPSTLLEDLLTLSDVQQSPTTTADVQENTSPFFTDDYQITTSTDAFGNENQSINSFLETDDKVQYEDSISYTTDEKALSEVDQTEHRQSSHSIEPLLEGDSEILLHTEPNESRSSSFALSNASQEQRTESLTQSYQIEREEDINSSLRNQTEEEENPATINISSTITIDQNLNEFSSLLLQDAKKPLSDIASSSDVEEVDPSPSPRLETRSDDDDDPNLAIIMQDLRYVFHELVNDNDLVEIDNDLPDRILDRLEFRDHFIRTLFDGLIRKYLVQPALQAKRPNILDWVEFRDILFPIITGRYTERHIRKLFDLLDITRNGYLSLQEIAELLEVLHANDTIDLAQNIINEFDTDHDGKLSVEELIEAIKNNDNINEHALSEETENQEWFNQLPNENQTITLEVPIINFPPKIDDRLTKGIPLLGRIFKRVGANSVSKQLDITNKNLSMQITNELINNNINLSSDELQFFIELYLDKKQETDSSIDWIEFRDLFLPIVNNGYYSKNNIKKWFDIFDTNENGIITTDQIIQLLHLLQIENLEEILSKLNEIIDETDSCTLDELIFLLDSVDESASHLVINTDPIVSFDTDWLSNNIF